MSDTLILSLKINDAWQDLLHIPKSELAHFSPRPLKWLVFVAYTVAGTEGQLSLDGVSPLAREECAETTVDTVGDRYFFIYAGTAFIFRFFCPYNDRNTYFSGSDWM